jgi:(E)-4-hydroxy-3-methylbut-2-enyl-diphosphate synthase
MIKRHKTREVMIGNVRIGNNSPISIQSMTKTKTEDIKATVRQIRELEDLGCHIIRIAIPRMSSALAIHSIKRQVNIPIEADIHFNPKLALESIKQGIDAVRLNPGNLQDKNAIKEIVKQAKAKNIPIRVGINSGSVWNWQGIKKNTPDWQIMVDCAIEYCRYLESLKFHDIMVSLKASDVISTILAYRLMAKKTDYPLHLGVTGTGPLGSATVKSAIGIGTLLLEGIGDTIRVSVTGQPHEEVLIGHEILEALGLGNRGWEIIACPTCGRCELDIVKICGQVKSAINKLTCSHRNKPVKIAVMGCVVNGPGEAREADIGIAGAKDFAFLFKHGERIRKIPTKRLVPEFISEIKKLIK